MKATVKQISEEFNNNAASLGCAARIWKKGKQPAFFEFRGQYQDGFEIWYSINLQRFVTLTQKYPQLQN